MGSPWRDVVTTVAVGAIAVVYAAFLGDTSPWPARTRDAHEMINSGPAARE